MHPIILETDNFIIYSYSIYLLAACILALGIALREARLRALEYKLAPLTGIILICCGFLGAKILGTALRPLYSGNAEIINTSIFSNSNLVLSGAFIFGAMGTSLFLKSKKQPLFPWFDAFAPAISIGMTIGWLGCFLSGFGYGTPSSLPWAVTYTAPESLAQLGVPVHPTQIYYSIAYAIIFSILIFTAGRTQKHGTVSSLFLVLSGISNFTIDFFRADHHYFVGFISASQFITLAFILIGVYLLIQTNYGSK